MPYQAIAQEKLEISSTTLSPKEELAHLNGLLITSPANIEVAKRLRELSQNFRARSPEDKDLLTLSAKTLSIHRIKLLFDKCITDKEIGKSLGARILLGSFQSESAADPCAAILESSELKVLNKLNNQLTQKQIEDAKSLLLSQSQKNLAKTYLYWERRIDNGETPKGLEKVCANIKCNDAEKALYQKTESEVLAKWPTDEQGKKPEEIAEFLSQRAKAPKKELKSQEELLLFTKTLKDKKAVSKEEVLAAQKEVKDLVADQMISIRSLNLGDLVRTNPAAVGQILLDHPEFSGTICNTINQVASDTKSDQAFKKVYFWGGLVVGGALLLTGIGAVAGSMVLGASWATTLTVMAAVSAIGGTAQGIAEATYATSNAYKASNEALAFQASFLSQNGDRESNEESQKQIDEAKDQLISAGLSAGSVLPYGSIWNFMRKSAQAALVTKGARAAKVSQLTNESLEGAESLLTTEQKLSVLTNLTQTIREIKDAALENIFASVRVHLSEASYGTFLGMLSQLNPEVRKKIFTAIKENPDKLTDAISKVVNIYYGPDGIGGSKAKINLDQQDFVDTFLFALKS